MLAREVAARDAPLLVGRRAERHIRRAAGDAVFHLHAVAAGPDARVAGAHFVIHDDRALEPQFKPRVARQIAGGNDADAQQRVINRRFAAVRRANAANAALRRHQRLSARIQVDVNAVLRERVEHRLGEALRQEGQQAGHHLKEMHLDAAVGQLLGHLDADEAAADDGRLLLRAALNDALEADAVLHGAQGVNALCVRARNTGHDGARARRDDELVIRALEDFAVVQIADGDGLRAAVDPGDLVVDKGGNAALVRHLIDAQADQIVRFLNHIADEIRQAACAVADVAGFFKHGDIQRRIDALGLGSGAQTCGRAADDNHFFSHGCSLPSGK